MKRVIAIGNFDGVHAGHRTILAETCRIARAHKAAPCVLTFSPNPRQYFNPSLPPLNIMSLEEKIEAIAACCIREVIIAEFNTDMATLPAEAFAKDVLVKRLNAHHVVTGEGFIFGRGRGGNATLLKQWLGAFHVGATAVGVVSDADGALSSTRIRAALAQGNMEEASRMLGRTYAVSGTVEHGDKRGRELGFPTLNLSLSHRLAPRHGVYTAKITIGKKSVPGVASVGVKPTFGGQVPLLEAHAFSKLPQLYGNRVRVELLHFMRPELMFESAKELVDQMVRDVIEAKALFSHA